MPHQSFTGKIDLADDLHHLVGGGKRALPGAAETMAVIASTK